MAEEIERVHYYQNEFLGAEDFEAEQAYHRDMRRRHNLAHHRWGIVTGLELVQIPKPNGSGAHDVYIYPGFAVDGFGREIIVTERTKLDPALFASFNATRELSVWIAYRELTDTPPANGYTTCDNGDVNKRVHEEFVAVIDPPAPTHLPIVVDGRNPAIRTVATPAADISILPDESVPYQDLPAAPNARWLVRLGSVQWTYAVSGGYFSAATADQLSAGRVYTGIIASEVLTPTETLKMRRRLPFDPANLDKVDFATVEGRLQVDGRIVAKSDLYMHGGRVHLQGSGGAENKIPLWIKRIDNGAASDLRVHIGPDSGPDRRLQRFTVGPGTDETNPTQATEKAILAVKADDTVDITTGRVFFGTNKRQMLNLQAETYGVGVQNSTLYQRSESEFRWYRGGTHFDDPADGGNGAKVMTLDAFNALTVAGAIRAGSYLQANDVYVDGGRVHLRGPGGGIDTDDIGITRFRRGPDQNDLRLIIGDNVNGDDSLTVGPIVTGNFLEQFRVFNNGNVSMKGSLNLDTGQQVNIGSMRLGGHWPVDVVVVQLWLGGVNGAGTTGTFSFFSRMASVGSVNYSAALSHISNTDEAIDARWSVSLNSVQVVGANEIRYSVAYNVGDSDGYLWSVSLMFVLVP